MIVHPSYLEMMEKVNEGSEDGSPIVHSRYSIVMAASKRARQVIAADLPEQVPIKRPFPSRWTTSWTARSMC